MALQLRRGTNAQRASVIFDQGELVYTTDTKKEYVGDGSTAGGIQVGNFDTDTGILNVVEDTTPQLGGNLDLNNFNLSGTGNISITGNITLPSANVINASTIRGVGTSGNITIASIDGSTVSGNITLQAVDTAIAGQEGGDVNIVAGNGLTTGSGGDIGLIAGNGGASASGGFINIQGGNAGVGGTKGGDVSIVGGFGPAMGDINIGPVNTNRVIIGGSGVTVNVESLINGDLNGSVFADDSTCIVDATFGGGYLTAEQASITGNLYLCEPYSNTPTKKAWQILENSTGNFFQTIVNADSLGTSTGPHLALQVYRSSPAPGDAGGQIRFYQSAGNPLNPVQSLVGIDAYAETIGVGTAKGELRFLVWNQTQFDTAQVIRANAIIFNKGITVSGGGINCNGAGTFALGINGDLKGSVVADNSTMLVDSVGGKIVGPVENNYVLSDLLTLTPTTVPGSPVPGMVAASDGVTWDPASDGLEHLNAYLNGAWVQIA